MRDLYADLRALAAEWETTRDLLRRRSPADGEWAGDKMNRREANTWDVAAEKLRAILAAHTPPSETATEECEDGVFGSQDIADALGGRGPLATPTTPTPSDGDAVTTEGDPR